MVDIGAKGESAGVERSFPLLLLDVDGPLNAYEMDPAHQPADYFRCPVTPTWVSRLSDSGAPSKPLRVHLRRSHGPSLRALKFELCWASAWMGEANQWISTALGLPPLPFVDFGDTLFVPDSEGLHWKTRTLLDHAQGRAFAWVDDELGDADRAYVAAHHDAPALLHHVDPSTGLTQDDFSVLAAWASSVG